MTLSTKQRECLAWFSKVEGPAVWFAAGTLSSLRKAGLLERFNGFGPGGTMRTHYRITEAGRVRLKKTNTADPHDGERR